MRKRTLILIVILGISILGLLLLGQVNLLAGANLLNQNPSPPSSTYDPAHYGLPPTISGYKTFAVLTSDNTACMMPGEKRLVLQATQANVQDYLSASNHTAIQQDLQQRGLTDWAQAGVQIVGPGTTLDQFLGENQKWNEERQKYGCATSAPMVPLTPTQ